MYGMDLSNYKASIDLKAGKDNYEFCIIKATEGIGFTDKSFFKFAEELTKLDKLIGCYHFARPDLHPARNEMINEADYFIEEVAKAELLDKAILVLDWEKPPFDDEEMIMTWVNRVIDKTGVIPFIYGSKSKLDNWQNWNILKSLPVWLAYYPSFKQFVLGGPSPHKPIIKYSYEIWQYSNQGKYPYYPGKIDLDIAYIDKDTWKQYASSKVLEPEEESLTPAMQWCIEHKIFLGDGEGHYFPHEPLTREQAAQVIVNVMNMDKGEFK